MSGLRKTSSRATCSSALADKWTGTCAESGRRRMPGKETIVLVDITQPQCTRTYGSAPCTAVTRHDRDAEVLQHSRDCQDSAHYLASPIVTRYSLPNDGLFDFGPIIPALSESRNDAVRRQHWRIG
jgi:hypothetical protein